MSTGWVPLGQPPGGVAWRSKIYKSFGLVVPPELGTTNAGYSTAEYGLSFVPALSFVEAGTSVASVTLSTPVSLLQQAPRGTVGLAFSPSFVFSGAEQYTNSLALFVGPIHFEPSGVESYPRSVLLSFAPAITPTGTGYSLDTANRPLRPPNPMVGPMALRKQFPRKPISSRRLVVPSFDATTAKRGNQGNNVALTWSHTLASNANAIIVVVAYASSSSTQPSVDVTVGGTAAAELSNVLNYNFNGSVYADIRVFGLLNPSTGSQTVSVTPSGNGAAMNCHSLSYIDVGSFGTPATTSGTSATPSLAVPTANGELVFAAFADYTTTFASFNQTQRHNTAVVANQGYSVVSGDGATTASSITFSTSEASADFGAIGIPLQPVK